MQTTAFTGIGRREPVHYMVPLPAAEARRDRLSGKIAHLYNDSFAHEFAIHQVVNCTRRGFAGCVLTLPGNVARRLRSLGDVAPALQWYSAWLGTPSSQQGVGLPL